MYGMLCEFVFQKLGEGSLLEQQAQYYLTFSNTS